MDEQTENELPESKEPAPAIRPAESTEGYESWAILQSLPDYERNNINYPAGPCARCKNALWRRYIWNPNEQRNPGKWAAANLPPQYDRESFLTSPKTAPGRTSRMSCYCQIFHEYITHPPDLCDKCPPEDKD